MWLTGRTKGLKHQIQITNVFIWIWMKRSKPKLGFLLQRSFIMWRRLLFPLCHHRSAVRWLIPAKALEILSFFHSQGWSYSSGGRSSSCGRRLSLGQRERSGSESPPFSAGSYGVSYRGSCLTDPSFAPLPVPPDRISMGEKKKGGKDWSLLVLLCVFAPSSLTKWELLHTNAQSYKKGALLFYPFFLYILLSSAASIHMKLLASCPLPRGPHEAVSGRTAREQCNTERMKYYATLLYNCLLAQGSSCRKMSNALSLVVVVEKLRRWNEEALPGPISQHNPALGELKHFDLAV